MVCQGQIIDASIRNTTFMQLLRTGLLRVPKPYKECQNPSRYMHSDLHERDILPNARQGLAREGVQGGYLWPFLLLCQHHHNLNTHFADSAFSAQHTGASLSNEPNGPVQ